MPKQIPCLWFDGQAEEAAQHYTSIFPNSSIGDITRYGPDMPPPMTGVNPASRNAPEMRSTVAGSKPVITRGVEIGRSMAPS